jgi:hypothetical protein
MGKLPRNSTDSHRQDFSCDSDSAADSRNDETMEYENVIPIARCTSTKFVEMCESMLCFHAFYKQKNYWKVGDNTVLKKFDKSLRAMMCMVITTMDRGEKTYNWNIQKFHEILHLPKQIAEFGNISNTDAGFGERGLKYWAKRPGRRALKGNTEVFTASTINRVREHVALRKAACQISDKEYYLENHIPNISYSYTSDDSRSSDYNTSGNSSHSDSDEESDKDTVSSNTWSHTTISDGNETGKTFYPQNVGNYVHFKNRHKFIISFSCDDKGKNKHVCSTTMPYVRTKQPLFLPQDIVELYEDEYFVPSDDTEGWSAQDIERCRNLQIKVYTEVKLSTGIILRAHPNYGGDGPLYDFGIVPGASYSPNDSTRRSKKKKRTVDENHSHIGDMYPNHVPSRIISLFLDPNDGVEKAFIHRCKDRSQRDIDQSSVLLESWNLETCVQAYYETNDGKYHHDKQRHRDDRKNGRPSKVVHIRQALFRVVPVASIKGGIWAVPDEAMFDEYDLNSEEAGNVTVVLDRDKYWSPNFF